MIDEEQNKRSLCLGLEIFEELAGKLEDWWVGNFEGPLNEGVWEVLINSIFLEVVAALFVISDEVSGGF